MGGIDLSGGEKPVGKMNLATTTCRGLRANKKRADFHRRVLF